MTDPMENALPLSSDTVLVQTRHCTVRRQRDQHLIYNSRTDELHLIPSTGIYVYQLCDGLATVAEIEAVLVRASGCPAREVGPALARFLSLLVDRGLLAIDVSDFSQPSERRIPS